ncbi:hypothetical protein GN956_G26185 [Arapaima gigas]
MEQRSRRVILGLWSNDLQQMDPTLFSAVSNSNRKRRDPSTWKTKEDMDVSARDSGLCTSKGRTGKQTEMVNKAMVKESKVILFAIMFNRDSKNTLKIASFM